MTEADQTRRHLAEIPELAARLPEFLTGLKGGDQDNRGGRRNPAKSRPPFDLALLDLIDGREIYNWTRLVYETMDEWSWQQFADNTDERNKWISEHPGPTNWDDLTACCQWLAQHSDWIAEQFPEPKPIGQNQDGCNLYCTDGHYLTRKRIRTRHNRQMCGMCPIGFEASIEALHWAYRRAARDLPGPKIACLKCGNEAFIADGWLVCREVREHQRTVKSIEMEYRRRLPMPSDDLLEEFHIEPRRLHEWTRTRKLRPAGIHKTGGRGRPKKTFWPWDVFLLCNPAIAEALAQRDIPA